MKKQQKIIGRIAAEYPYSISQVTSAYTTSLGSEEKTRELLSHWLSIGL